MTPRRTLIVRTGALGDVLMLLPLVQALHAEEGEHVSLVVQETQAGLLSRFEGVAQAVSADAVQLWRLYGDGDPGRLPPCDRVLAFLKDSDGALHARLRAATGAEVAVFPPFPAAAVKTHVSHYYLQCVFPGRTTPGRWPRFQPLPEDRDWVAAWARSVVPDRPLWALNPGSGSPAKNWPVERFHEVAVRLAAGGRCLALVLGPAEADRREQWAQLFAECNPGLVFDWNLERIAALLLLCEGFLGNDSGITHLAALLGVNTVAVYGPTDPDLWAPRGQRVRVVAKGPGRWPAAAAVVRAAEE